ncbi:hypothetical protein F5X96DRAFT_546851 [Biscogniauxia mediterranea]|nr:hypothetical protein F5X96DRAFT_546851 [Biscogniauxia mediterranea]
MPQPGQSTETSYMPSEGYKGEIRNIRMPSEQTRSLRLEDGHLRDHSPFSARDPRTPRTLPERQISHSPSPGYESPDAQSPTYRYREVANSAVSSYRRVQSSHDEDHQQSRPSNRPSQPKTARFDKSRTDNGRDRHARLEKPEPPKPALGHLDHSSPQKSKEGPKKTVRFADEYPPEDSAPRKRTATKSSRGHRLTPSGPDDPKSPNHHHHHQGEASGTQPARAVQASKTMPASTSGSHGGQKIRQSTYYHVPSPPATPRIPREPTPDFDAKGPMEQRDPARHQFCACCPPSGGSGAGCDRARERRVSAKMYKQLGDAREHIARTSSKGTRRIGEA